MKKLLVPILALVLMSVTSCEYFKSGDSGEDGKDSCDTAEVVVSDVYCSPDLRLKELKGKVKECAYTMCVCDENGENMDEDCCVEEFCYVFDENGMFDFKSPDFNWRLKDPKVKRDAEGRVVEAKWYISDYDSYVSEEFVYDADGSVKICKNSGIESEDGMSYTYDKNGELIKSVSEGAGEGSIFRITMTYKILETDENDNWTVRFVKSLYEYGDDDGSGTYDDDEKSEEYHLQVRNITYWQ